MIDNWEKKIGGMKPSEFDPRDYKMQVTYGALDLPESYNSNVKYNVHNQGTYNNCAAHALSSYIEILLRKKGAFKEISFPWFYGDRNYTEHKDEGLISRDLLKTAQKDGGLYLSDYSKIEEMKQAMYSFNKAFPSLKEKAQNMKLGNYYQCTTVQQVKEAIYKYGSCMIGTLVFKSFSNVATGKTLYMNEPIISDDHLEEILGGHMMLAVGWIKDYFVVQNSWGEDFGDKGYFYMPFSLATWNQRTGFPLSVFEAWAIDGIYLNDKFISLDSTASPEEPVVPESKDRWYKTDDGKWRYKLDNGKNATGWMVIDNKTYHFKDNGDMSAKEWKQVDGKWKYLKESGAAAKNEWQKVFSRWYWFDEDEFAITGWRNIDGVDYYFAEKKFGLIKECECMVSCK